MDKNDVNAMLEYEDWLVNNMVAILLRDVSKAVGNISAIHDSKNFDTLSEHKKKEIMSIEHHLESALIHLSEYFMIRNKTKAESEGNNG